jgi:hypothetical protein
MLASRQHDAIGQGEAAMRDYFGALAFWLIMLAQFGAVISAGRRCRGRTGIPGATRTGYHEGFLSAPPSSLPRETKECQTQS